MARHIWLNKKFGKYKLSRAFHLLKLAQALPQRKMTNEELLILIGYLVESENQKGQHICKDDPSIRRVILGTKHRYREGKNRDNYLHAARTMVSQLAVILGFGDDPAEVSAEIFMDYFNEAMDTLDHELHTKIYRAIKGAWLH